MFKDKNLSMLSLKRYFKRSLKQKKKKRKKQKKKKNKYKETNAETDYFKKLTLIAMREKTTKQKKVFKKF